MDLCKIKLPIIARHFGFYWLRLDMIVGQSDENVSKSKELKKVIL